MKTIILYLAILIGLSIGLSIGSYYTYRYINYHLLYKGWIKEDIQRLVKPECLK